ncbi:MAG TPA: ABC transporter permease, partial [Vicinamibacterales bacterium]
ASATLATVQAAALLLLGVVAGVAPSAVSPLFSAAAVLAALAVGLSALGVFIAWRFDSIQGFHAVMNLVLVPLWLLSGAAFPASGAAGWVQLLMAINPLTYGVAALRQVLTGASLPGEPGLAPSLGVVLVFGCAALAAGVAEVSREGRR